MTDKLLYQTTLSAKARRGLLLNILAGSLLALLSGFQWYTSGHWLQAVIFCIVAPVAVMIVIVLLRSKHPLEVFEDRVALNSLIRTTVPLANIDGIGTHPRRGTPSLSVRGEGAADGGEFPIHWKFIREPQEEVIAQINRALEQASQ